MASAAAANPVRIILLTMVKNEERNVKRLFDSVRTWIDGYVLCDTGSTDKTRDIATSYITASGKPGKVYEYAWENFGKSRTRSFQCFQEWVGEMGWDPARTWALLLDGDMVLPDESGLHVKLALQGPNCGGAQIPQRNGNLIYKNTRLLRASKTWRCIGATHEYWGCDDGSSASFEDPIITDIGDGGCKADKYTRDARLLEEELATDPNNVRTLFYLGQTYMSIPGKHADAVRVLTRRIDLGGWDEERYIAHCYKGDCLKTLGREAEATEEWLKAWQLRQHRTEAPMRLITHYRSKPAMAFVAYMFAEKLLQIQTGLTAEGHKVCEPAKNGDILFVSHRDMVYPFWEELGIVAFYAGRHDVGRRHMDRHVADAALNLHERNRLLDLYQWYSWRLPTLKSRVALSVSAEQIPWIAEGFWRAFNPSIRLNAAGDAYVVNLRHANYETKEARFYTYRGLDGTIVTRNVVVTMGADLKATEGKGAFEVKIPSEYIQNTKTHIHGVEDCRWLGESSLICTSRQFNPIDSNKIVRVNLDMTEGSFKGLERLRAPIEREEVDCQKNWLPFIWQGQEMILYKISPFQVFALGKEGSWRPMVDWKPPATSGITFDNLRGSAPPVAWKSQTRSDEVLILVAHFCYYGSGNEGRRYYHRFITMGADLKPRRMSRIFSLCDDKIQYVAGMCERIGGGGYVITYGVNDSQAWAIEVAAETIEAALEYHLV